MGTTKTVTLDGGLTLTVWAVTLPWSGEVSLTAWEPTDLAPDGDRGHGTIGGPEALGRLGTRNIPEWIQDLPPASPARKAACDGWRMGQDYLVREALLVAFPETKGARMDMAAIEIPITVSQG